MYKLHVQLTFHKCSSQCSQSYFTKLNNKILDQCCLPGLAGIYRNHKRKKFPIRETWNIQIRGHLFTILSGNIGTRPVRLCTDMAFGYFFWYVIVTSTIISYLWDSSWDSKIFLYLGWLWISTEHGMQNYYGPVL